MDLVPVFSQMYNSRGGASGGAISSASGSPPRRRRRLSRSRSAKRLSTGDDVCGGAEREAYGRVGGDPGADDRRPRAVFLMGLPGAGKTTVKRRRLGKEDWVDIEPDRFKHRHPRYSEDMGNETDEEVHRWSVRRAVDAFDTTVTLGRRPDVVLDSSGSNASWLRRRISLARSRGYRIELLWVDVPLEIALLRNRDRAYRLGDRTMVPEKVILDKAELLPNSFNELRREADATERLQNWSESSGERRRADYDLYFYPPPRTRPPGRRQGERGWGEMPAGACMPSRAEGSRRTLLIGPWKRNDDVMREKNQRLEWMDRTFRGNRERYVLDEVLGNRDILLEPNRYPYQLPPGLEHWTIWALRAMNHDELCEYIEGWLDARVPHDCISWNYDDNRGKRTIDIWHVHIYFQGRDGKSPGFRSPHSAVATKRPSQLSASRHRMSPCSV